MVKAIFEHEANIGLLKLTTHFGQNVVIRCLKCDDESFRLGGTAVNEVIAYEGVVLKLPHESNSVDFRAFRSEDISFESNGILSDEDWTEADLHCWITEYYDIHMEGKPPGWFVSKNPIKDAHYLFINLDILDGGGNILRRYRVSPFTGEYKIMEIFNG